jgi:sugar-specific transcriptional regulator TrmB
LGALIGLGIPDNDAQIYSNLLEQGHYLVVIDGNETQISHAGEIFTRKGIRQWQVYDVNNATAKHANNLG